VSEIGQSLVTGSELANETGDTIVASICGECIRSENQYQQSTMGRRGSNVPMFLASSPTGRECLGNPIQCDTKSKASEGNKQGFNSIWD
jgi:hypothetical protein